MEIEIIERDETELRLALRAGTETLQPSVGQLVSGGLRRGRRMRLAGRLRAAGAAAAVLGLAATGAVLAPGIGGRAAPVGPAGGSGNVSIAPASPDAAWLAARAPLLLPDLHGSWEPNGESSATALVSDAQGRVLGRISVGLAVEPTTATAEPEPEPCDPPPTEGQLCVQNQLPDGTRSEGRLVAAPSPGPDSSSDVVRGVTGRPQPIPEGRSWTAVATSQGPASTVTVVITAERRPGSPPVLTDAALTLVAGRLATEQALQ